MLYSRLVALAALLVSASAAPEPILLNLKRNKVQVHPLSRYENLGLSKRANTADGVASLELDNQFLYYSVQVELGTPNQTIDVIIDTGSSDFWVMDKSNPYCGTDGSLTDGSGGSSSSSDSSDDSDIINCSQAFDYTKSSTFSFNRTGVDFFITYGDSSFAEGRWGTDVVSLGDLTLKNASVALALMANATAAIMGIGYQYLESTEEYLIQPSGTTELPVHPTASSQLTGQNVVTPYLYENIPAQLYIDGQIGAYAYSLWLNDVDNSNGILLFGGVDHEKYQGTLQTVPLINTSPELSDTPFEFNIVLSSLGLIDTKGDSSTVVSGPIPALLDSGTSFCLLPSQYVAAIAYQLDYLYSSDLGGYIGECEVAGDGTPAIVFNFSGVNINVNLSEIVLPLQYNDGSQAMWSNGKSACSLAILPSTSDTILGDTFLRSAYVVYDLANFEISLANTNYNATGSNVEAIGSSVPSASQAQSYSSTAVISRVAQIELNTAVSLNFGVTPGASLVLSGGPTGISLTKQTFSDEGTGTDTAFGTETGNPRGSAGSAKTTSGSGSSAAASTNTSETTTSKKSSASTTKSSLPFTAIAVFVSLVSGLVALI